MIIVKEIESLFHLACGVLEWPSSQNISLVQKAIEAHKNVLKAFYFLFSFGPGYYFEIAYGFLIAFSSPKEIRLGIIK